MICLVTVATPCRAGGQVRYVTPPSTIAPNGKLGVSVPVFDPESAGDPDRNLNKVVEIPSGKIAATIDARPGYDRPLNHRELAPARWSEDSSLLLWEVSGKWFPTALVLLRFEGERLKWQLDLLGTAQKEILARTRQAAPAAYAAAMAANAGNGAAFPDGFTVDVTTSAGEGEPVALPLTVGVTLTANPKQIEDFPVDLASSLEAMVTKDGRFVVESFRLEP